MWIWMWIDIFVKLTLHSIGALWWNVLLRVYYRRVAKISTTIITLIKTVGCGWYCFNVNIVFEVKFWVRTFRLPDFWSQHMNIESGTVCTEIWAGATSEGAGSGAGAGARRFTWGGIGGVVLYSWREVGGESWGARSRRGQIWSKGTSHISQ